MGLVEAPSIADFGLRTAKLLTAAVLLIVCGCRSTPAPPPHATIAWQTDLALALDDARRTGRPILVLAVIGDIDRQC